LWDIDSVNALWSCESVLGTQRKDAERIMFSPNGRYIAFSSAGSEPPTSIVEAKTGKKLFQTTGRAEFSPDSKRAIFSGEQCTLWDLESATMLRDFGRTFFLQWFVFSPNSHVLW